MSLCMSDINFIDASGVFILFSLEINKLSVYWDNSDQEVVSLSALVITISLLSIKSPFA